MTFYKYKDQLEKAMMVNNMAEQLDAPKETVEVRSLIAELQNSSLRLVKILAKRVAGNVREET